MSRLIANACPIDYHASITQIEDEDDDEYEYENDSQPLTVNREP